MNRKRAQRLHREADQETENPDMMISCDEVVKIYMSDGRKVMALQGLDLEVRRGELTAVVGKSGSGKSTLLNLIGGLETPTAGRLFVNGRDMSNFREKELVSYRKSTVGFVWQNSVRNLFPYMTVLDNVCAPMGFAGVDRKESVRRAEELIGLVGMSQYRDQRVSRLSGGEQQRIAIAVALANRPKLLLADEPTGALDTRTADQIFSLFGRLNRELNLTILIVTHDMGIAGKVDRTVRISDGKISTETLRQSTGENMQLLHGGFSEEDRQEYSVLDKAHRVQLSEEMLAAAGIRSNKVRIEVEGQKVIITAE